MSKIKIGIYAITGDSFCVAAEDGEKVFAQIKKALLKGKKIDISFLNVKMLTSAFLNTSIGKVYGESWSVPNPEFGYSDYTGEIS